MTLILTLTVSVTDDSEPCLDTRLDLITFSLHQAGNVIDSVRRGTMVRFGKVRWSGTRVKSPAGFVAGNSRLRHRVVAEGRTTCSRSKPWAESTALKRYETQVHIGMETILKYFENKND